MSSQVEQLLLAAKAASGLSVRAIARKAGLSHATVSAVLNGERRTHPIPDKTLEKLARGFEIPLPQLRRAMDADRTLRSVPDQEEIDVRGAILADPALLPEARAHLLNQYELLLRLHPPTADELLVGQERRRQQAAVEAAGRAVLEQARDASISTSRRPRKD